MEISWANFTGKQSDLHWFDKRFKTDGNFAIFSEMMQQH